MLGQIALLVAIFCATSTYEGEKYLDQDRVKNETKHALVGRLFGESNVRKAHHTSYLEQRRLHARYLATEPVYHIFGPCTFPPPQFRRTYSTRPGIEAFQPLFPSQFRQVCKTTPQLPFICDLHDALHQRELNIISSQFARNRRFFCSESGDDTPLPFGILIGKSLTLSYRQAEGVQGNTLVRHLAQPVSVDYVTRHNPEFECLFRLPCLPMNDVTLDKFVHNVRTFAKLYIAAVFTRWFPTTDRSASEEENQRLCSNPRVMILIIFDGVLSNPKKLTTVYLYTDNHSFQPFISNIHMEVTNVILQGVPLADVLSDMIQQLAFAYDDFRMLGGQPRRHGIPMWAWHLVGVCVSLAILSLVVEWLIVRKRFTRKRYIPGPVVDSLKSKAHMIF